MAIRTVNVDELADKTGNLYKTVAIVSKRSRQVATSMKTELDDKLTYFEGFDPELEDPRFREEQERISIKYENKPKPMELAIDEMLNDQVYHRDPGEEE